MVALLCHLYDINKYSGCFVFVTIHTLAYTLLCNLPALNKMMCPNQPPLVLFQWQRNHQVMHLLVEIVPKVVHSTNCNTILFMGDHICLRFYKQSMHNMLYMFTSMHIYSIILPLSLPFLPFIRTDTCTDFILIIGTCVAASDVLRMDN